MAAKQYLAHSLNRIAGRFGYNVAISRTDGIPSDMLQADIDLFLRVRPFTMTTIERISALRLAVEYVVKHEIPGDIVECGVWRGGSMMAAVYTLLALGDTSRRVVLYDTFKGMGPPTQEDGADVHEQWSSALTADHNRWCFAPLEDVKKNLESTGYPVSRIHYVQGLVEETLPSAVHEQIAILRLDTDFYPSTLAELKYLYPRLLDGGVLIIDDYGHFAGARRAVDEYFTQTERPPMFCRTDYTARTCIKPATVLR